MLTDDNSQEFTSESSEPAAPVEQVENHSTETQVQEPANPFWGEVEKLTGPNVYKLIQPHLAKADTEARNRISALNQSFAPWKALVDQGIAPEHVQQSLGVVRQLNDQPEVVYESLRTFLEREGRLPSNTELAQEVEENDEEVDLRDQQLSVLQQQQQQVMQFLQEQYQSQQLAAAAQEADSWLDSEVNRVKALPAGFDESDIQDIVRIAAFQAQQNGQDPESLDAAVAQFQAMRDRIRTSPRPGQLAPRIPSGAGGGTPSGGGIDPANMSKDQRRAVVAEMLQRRS